MKLDEVINKTLDLLSQTGYTEKTWKLGFRNGRFSSVREFYEERGENEFNVELTKEYIPYSTKYFLIYLFEQGILKDNFAAAVYCPTVKQKKYYQYLHIRRLIKF